MLSRKRRGFEDRRFQVLLKPDRFRVGGVALWGGRLRQGPKLCRGPYSGSKVANRKRYRVEVRRAVGRERHGG